MAGYVNPADRRAYYAQLDTMVDAIHRYDLAGIGAPPPTMGRQFEKAPLEDILEMTFPVDPKLKNRVGNRWRPPVRSCRFPSTTRCWATSTTSPGAGHKTLVTGCERSGRYRPMIQRILDEEGVPQELIHLAQAESGFIPRAVSRARPAGMWQFLA